MWGDAQKSVIRGIQVRLRTVFVISQIWNPLENRLCDVLFCDFCEFFCDAVFMVSVFFMLSRLKTRLKPDVFKRVVTHPFDLLPLKLPGSPVRPYMFFAVNAPLGSCQGGRGLEVLTVPFPTEVLRWQFPTGTKQTKMLVIDSGTIYGFYQP